MMKCVLCSTERPLLVERFKSVDVLKLYKRYLKVVPNQLNEINKTISLYQCKKCGLKYFYPSIVGDEEFYNQLQKFDWYYLKDKEEYSYAKQFVSQKDKVLDVGCGSGEFAKVINSKNYTGLEFNKKAIKDGKKHGIKILRQSVEYHSSKNISKYNVVSAFQVLEHADNPHEFVISCIKCLKKNGKLIISVPSDDTFVGLTSNAVLNLPPHHQTRWSDKTLKYIAMMFNLKIISIYHEPLSSLHYEWFTRLLVSRSIEKVFRRKYKIVDLGISKYTIDVLSFYIAKLLSRGLDKFSETIYGHSVTAVYEK